MISHEEYLREVREVFESRKCKHMNYVSPAEEFNMITMLDDVFIIYETPSIKVRFKYDMGDIYVKLKYTDDESNRTVKWYNGKYDAYFQFEPSSLLFEKDYPFLRRIVDIVHNGVTNTVVNFSKVAVDRSNLQAKLFNVEPSCSEDLEGSGVTVKRVQDCFYITHESFHTVVDFNTNGDLSVSCDNFFSLLKYLTRQGLLGVQFNLAHYYRKFR